MSSAPGKSEKLGKIVDALYAKTVSGEIRWGKARIGGSYSVRFDNYIMHLEKGANLLDAIVSLTIKKIDGSLVANISRAVNVLSPGDVMISPSVLNKVELLYKFVDDFDEDLDDLLRKLT